MSSIDNRLIELEKKIIDKDFRDRKKLANEVPYYIFDYDPKDELVVRETITHLVSKFKSESDSFQIVCFDLYKIITDLLIKEGFFDLCIEFEQKKGFWEITKAINELLKMEEDNEANEILSHIKNNTPKNAIIFLVGVGKCYPLLRSHKILNNLHQYIDDIPVVMFFPGTYDGGSLMLFNEIKDDNYYRAFKLID